MIFQALDDDSPPCLGITFQNLIDAGLAKSTPEGRLKVVFSQFGNVNRGAHSLSRSFYVHLSLPFS